jgi:hypothetical protein
MKSLITLLLFLSFNILHAQEIETIFGRNRSAGAYLALSNKFTTLGATDTYANISEVYGGVFVNRRWMVGFSVAGSTNNIRVPIEYSVYPLVPMTYQYGQGGMKVEYVMNSNRPVHLVLNMFGGVGFTAQYQRHPLNFPDYNIDEHDANWFYVLEPGAQLEMNLFKWLRLSPGVSYRNTYGSSAAGMSDAQLSNWSYNLTLKIGSFGRNKYYRSRSTSKESQDEDN